MPTYLEDVPHYFLFPHALRQQAWLFNRTLQGRIKIFHLPPTNPRKHLKEIRPLKNALSFVGSCRLQAH